jgi:hypothetical protein
MHGSDGHRWKISADFSTEPSDQTHARIEIDAIGDQVAEIQRINMMSSVELVALQMNQKHRAIWACP